MPIHNPPFYRYSLFESWDKEAFEAIKDIGKNRTYPSLKGSQQDKKQFLTTLIRTQKSLQNWRDMLKDILEQIKIGTIDTSLLNDKYPPESISKDTPAWVTYQEDKIVNNFIDELATRKIEFVGSDQEVGEFVARFILGQLGHDWEQTIMMIWEMLGDEETLDVKVLNKEMENFDYLKIFSSQENQP